MTFYGQESWTWTRRLLASLGLSAVVFVVFSWPLPRHFTTAIPASGQNQELGAMLEMFPGDHLQLMYHFWLMGDFIKGDTPWFHDLYEFNGGDDDERRWIRPYFVPFSLSFTAFSTIGGLCGLSGPSQLAFGYNATIYLVVWLTLFGAWSLARRFSGSEWTAVGTSLLCITFPYAWTAILGGHPGGFAMMWLPFLWLGIDGMLRFSRVRDGFVAFLAILGCATGDLQVLGFALIGVFGMALVSWIHLRNLRKSMENESISAKTNEKKALGWGIFGLGYLLAGSFALVTGLGFQGTSLEDGHHEISVALASPVWTDWFRWFGFDAAAHGFFGIFLSGFLVFGGLWAVFRGKNPPRLALFLLGLALLLGLLIGLGTNGPIIEGLRDLPGGTLLRQPTKAYLGFPVLLTVMAAMIGSQLVDRRWLLGALALIVVESGLQVRPFLCKLADDPAYQAVVADGGERALVVPLRSGGSAYDSTLQFHALRSGLKLANGYSPRILKNWHQDMYEGFRSVNRGVLTPQQTKRLRARGFTHLLFDESIALPDVLEFPPALVREGLLANPRLALMDFARSGRSDGGSASLVFRILAADRPDSGASIVGLTNVVADALNTANSFPSKTVELEDCLTEHGSVYVRQDSQSSFNKYLEMREPSTVLHMPPPGHERPLVDGDFALALRLRGIGSGEVKIGAGSSRFLSQSLDWHWTRVPVGGALAGRSKLTAESVDLTLQNGGLDLDAVLFLDGPVSLPLDGFELEAARGFHRAQRFERDGRSGLRFEPGRVSTAYPSWSGPGLPLAPGHYRLDSMVSVQGSSQISAGLPIELGEWVLGTAPETEQRHPLSVASDGPMPLRFEVRDNRPFTLQFFYAGKTSFVLNSIRVSRDQIDTKLDPDSD